MTNPGDTVEIITKTGSHKGVLLPRSEMLDSNIIVVKLSTGYNIGIDKKNIKSIKVTKKYKTPKVSNSKVAVNTDLPTVALLSFGGTISSRIDYKTGGVIADYDANDFLNMCPELKNVANIKTMKIASMMSEDMVPADWQKIAEAVYKVINDKTISGVVVTQGTDTLHYSTAALSFMLENLNKPVIFTASQRSIDRGSSDAFMNLSCAVIAAATFDGALVVTCMHGSSNDDYCSLIRGTKVRKMHTSRRDAFRPINDKELAHVFVDGTITIINTDYKKRNDGKTVLSNKFEEKVGFLQVYPNMDPKLIDFFIDGKYKGLIVSATALGHVPTLSKKTLVPKLKKAVKAGITVVIVSQTLYGRTHPFVYSNLRKVSMDAGCIYGEDILPEVAYIKLGWSLANKKEFTENICGEYNYQITADEYLN